MNTPDRDAYRLSTEDEQRISKRIADTLAMWHTNRSADVLHLTSDHHAILTRSAAGAIGCSTFDLRDSELAWIETRVTEAVAAYTSPL